MGPDFLIDFRYAQVNIYLIQINILKFTSTIDNDVSFCLLLLQFWFAIFICDNIFTTYNDLLA